MLAASRAGMLAIHLRRGPWGLIQHDWPEAAQADLGLTTLDGVAGALATAVAVLLGDPCETGAASRQRRHAGIRG